MYLYVFTHEKNYSSNDLEIILDDHIFWTCVYIKIYWKRNLDDEDNIDVIEYARVKKSASSMWKRTLFCLLTT